MTAIGVVGTDFGFIVAADGRVRLDDESRSHAAPEMLTQESDEQQKNFPITDAEKNLAYAITGSTGDPRGFDLLKIIPAQIRRISNRRFNDGCHYVKVLSEKINEGINDAKRGGAIKAFPQIDHLEQSTGWLIVRVFFVGYFDRIPCFVRADFVHFGGDSESRVSAYAPRYSILSGSDAVRREIYEDNGHVLAGSRFASYIKDLGSNPSLDDAEEYARGFIEACSSSLALELDEARCKGIGGSIHVAEITPSGFKWRVAPKKRETA